MGLAHSPEERRRGRGSHLMLLYTYLRVKVLYSIYIEEEEGGLNHSSYPLLRLNYACRGAISERGGSYSDIDQAFP